jgi:hypothetical protein
MDILEIAANFTLQLEIIARRASDLIGKVHFGEVSFSP